MPRRFINDQPTPANLRALWDQIHHLGDQLNEAQATIADQVDTLTSLQSNLTETRKRANEALLSVGERIDAVPGVVVPPSGAGGVQGGTDDGQGAQGCATSGADGHVAPGTPLTAITVGQIVCGTAREYDSLRAAAGDAATRLANQIELLLRVIWHLNLAGFTAGRQRNPSGLISNDKLTVQVGGVYRSWDIFQGVSFGIYLPVHMIEVFPAEYIAEAGTPD
jgi:hypothetical protein